MDNVQISSTVPSQGIASALAESTGAKANRNIGGSVGFQGLLRAAQAPDAAAAPNNTALSGNGRGASEEAAANQPVPAPEQADQGAKAAVAASQANAKNEPAEGPVATGTPVETSAAPAEAPLAADANAQADKSADGPTGIGPELLAQALHAARATAAAAVVATPGNGDEGQASRIAVKHQVATDALPKALGHGTRPRGHGRASLEDAAPVRATAEFGEGRKAGGSLPMGLDFSPGYAIADADTRSAKALVLERGASAGAAGMLNTTIGGENRSATGSVDSNTLTFGQLLSTASADGARGDASSAFANAGDSGLPPVPAQSAALAERWNSAAFAPALGLRISQWLKNGVQHAELALNPLEMGPVNLRMQLDGQTAQVHMTAERALTREALQAALPALAAALHEAGFTLAGGGVGDQAPRSGSGFAGSANGAAASASNAGAGQGQQLSEDASESLAQRAQNLAQARAQSRGGVNLYA